MIGAVHHFDAETRDTTPEQPDDRCVHELFETQAQRTPYAVALVFGQQEMTYGELNARAAALAERLRSLGVGPDHPVAICFERSLEMVVAMLGVLKAGGAYVPLDPQNPPERLALMIEDARPAVLLSQQHLLPRLPKSSAAVIMYPADSVCRRSRRHTESAGYIPAGPENLAYIIFTSGSTGRPKGVMIPHRAMVNLLLGTQRILALGSQDTLLAVTSLGFDPAVVEIFLPLILGGKVVIAPQEAVRDGVKLMELLDGSRATVMSTTPSTWQLLLIAGWQGGRPLKLVSGGEPLSLDLARSLLSRCDALWNAYGPTETAVTSTMGRVMPDDTEVTIGHPLSNTQAYVVDAQLRLVPIGTPGELCTGGLGVGRGYLNRPELTAERFVADPFRPGSGGRLYRTGDLARCRPDGRIEFLGRIDHQVKILGIRIELGEIDAALNAQPQVREAVTVVREDVPGQRRLVAYLVARDSYPPTAHELRAALQKKLPDSMLPSAFVVLDRLPLSPNGKVDRQALPKPTEPAIGRQRASAAPRTPVEALLATIWAEVLGLDEAALRDNAFLDLGGQSLDAMRVIVRVRDALGVELSFRDLIHAPTVASLAASLVELLERNMLGADAKDQVRPRGAATVLRRHDS